MTLDAPALMAKHQAKGVLVDTNLLVPYLVGLANKKRIKTPHVLSQVSDLIDLPGRELFQIRVLMKALIEEIEEHYDAARDLAAHPFFERLGLGDAGIATVCSKSILVLTADVELQLALQRQGVDALNFNHVRPLGWK